MDTRSLETIRLVTMRYGELQGLRLVLPGALNVAVFGAAVFAGSPGGLPPWPFGFFICVSLSLIKAWLDRFYETRFGIVDERGGASWIVKGLLLSGLFIAAVTLMFDGPLWLMFVPWAVAHLWIAIRDYPFRMHHFVGAAATCGAAGIVASAADPAAGQALGLAISLHGASLVVVGLCDHRLLAMLRVRDESVVDPTGDTA